MFNKITQTYNHLDASMEIIIMLLGAFLLGFLFSWLLRKFSTNNSHLEGTTTLAPVTQHANKSSFQNQPSETTNIKKTSLNKSEKTDFSIIKGITPKIGKLLNKKHVNTFSKLRDIDKETLKDIIHSSSLDSSSSKVAKTWAHQAALANKNDWRRLSEYQDYIEQSIISVKEPESTEEKDNLQKIKGIGPQIEKILNDKKIYTYKDLKNTDAGTLKEYIYKSDPRFKNNQTATWPHQASIAQKKKWKELSIYQDFMDDINVDSKNLAATIKDSKQKNRQLASKHPDDLSPALTQHYFQNNGKETKKSTPQHFKYQRQDLNQKSSVKTNNDKSGDDLKKLTGITKKTEKFLNSNGIDTFKKLYKYDKKSLESLFDNSNKNISKNNLKTWPHQAGMADREEWNELKTYQNLISETTEIHIKNDESINKSKNKKDDLKKIDGIGPKIEVILNQSGILTFKDLNESNRDTLKTLLDEAGQQYRMHEPKTWPIQAEMAYNNEWDKLKDYQQTLRIK